MTPKHGKFPFCRPVGGVVGSGTLYPAGLTQQQLFDLAYNAHKLTFNFNAVGGNLLDILTAFSIMATGTVLSFDVAGAILGNALGSRTTVAGTTDRIVDTGKCVQAMHRFNEDLCMIFIDTSDVLRDVIQYYPKMLILFFADGDVFTSYIEGSGGQSSGGIEIKFGNTSAAIVEMFPGTASAFDPFVFGNITVDPETYDGLKATKVGSNVEIEGIAFEETSQMPVVDRVRFGNTYSNSFTLSTDKRKLTVPIPASAKLDNIVIETKFVVGQNEYRNNIIVPKPFKP